LICAKLASVAMARLASAGRQCPSTEWRSKFTTYQDTYKKPIYIYMYIIDLGLMVHVSWYIETPDWWWFSWDLAIICTEKTTIKHMDHMEM
jgi:hypothetical protein